MTQISIVIITRNEQARLTACLESVRWADEIVVVDSHSTDETVQIAEQYGARVLLRRFDNFSGQKNFAVAQATKPWVFSLDADERVGEGLCGELKRTVQEPGACDGYWVGRDNCFLGRHLRHGGQSRDRQMRLFRAGRARYKNAVHEEVVIDGTTGVLTQRLTHDTCGSLNEYLEKFAQYTDLEVERLRERGVAFCWCQLLVRPWLRFVYTYVWLGGFLDGAQGFLFHALSAMYTFVKYAKLREKTSAAS